MTNEEMIRSWPYRMLNKKIKQKDVAEETGLDITAIHRILNGRIKDPKASTVDAIELAIQKLEEQ